MAKIHLRNGPSGKANDIKFHDLIPACDSYGRNYHVGHQVLSAKEFKNHPDENELCYHCKNEFLKRRNRQRRQKGLKPVSKYNEVTE